MLAAINCPYTGKSTRANSKSSAEEDPITLSAINSLLEKQLQPIHKKLEQVSSSVLKLEHRLTAFEKEQKDQEKAITFLGDEVADLKAEMAELQSKLASTDMQSLKERMELIEHNNRARQVEMHGIPPGEGEDLLAGVMKIANQIKVEIGPGEIDKVYRIRKSKRVVVTFLQTHKRDTFFKEFKKGDVCLKVLGFRSDERLYINEVLSNSQHHLLYEARKLKRDKKYEYLWTKNQKIYLRKDGTSDVIEVKSVDTLAGLP